MADISNLTVPPTSNDSSPISGEQPKPSTKRSLSIAGIITTLIIGVIVGAGGVGGYVLANQDVLHLTSGDTSNQSTTPTPSPTPQSTPTPTPDPTANWKTYTHKDGKYSFKYPADWHLTEEFEHDPYTESNTRLYESIYLSENGQQIIGLGYPFELTGCDQPPAYKAYIFGDEPSVMTSDCGGTTMYLGFFASPYQTDSTPPKSEPLLMISYNYSADHDTEFKLLAKSFTGLKLPQE